MNHSTTKTSTYTISKYSRAYPVKRTLAKYQLSSDAGPETMQEWQHFTNPTLRLLLDMKIARNKKLESVRLRIIWSINPTVDAEVGQQDVVFEDMDLLSFSSITAPVARKHQTEGLPLKAVYRDTVVGIRYFHGREDGITPVCHWQSSDRKMSFNPQISFQSASDASDFIALIKPVCPCRLNPTSAPSFAASQVQFINDVNVPHTQVQTRLPSSNSLLPNRGSPFTCSLTTNETIPIAKQTSFAQPIMQSAVEQPPLPRSFTLSSSLQRQEPPSDPRFFSPVTSGLPLFHPIPPVPLLAAPQTSSSHHANAARETPSVEEHSSVIPDINAILSQRINLPSSSLPSIPSSEPSIPNPDPTPANSLAAPVGPQNVIRPILASFVEATSIYNLSNTALEQIVAEVLNEDGFIQLVEKISEMTVVRRVANV